MFQFAYEFNQPIGDWDVSNVSNMSYMFYGAKKFNKNINNWNISNNTIFVNIIKNCPICKKYRPLKLNNKNI